MPGECEASLAWVRKRVMTLGDLPGSAAWYSRFAAPGAWRASMSKGWLLAGQSILSGCPRRLRRGGSPPWGTEFLDFGRCRVGGGAGGGFLLSPLLGGRCAAPAARFS